MESYTTDVQCSNTEWANQLIQRISPHIISGFKSIFNESVELCEKNGVPNKYLMTFQNLLSSIPHWNQVIIENEKQRIITKSGCSYLEDLITCIHVNQLRLLSYARAGSESHKIEINIPELSLFIHRVYINIARKFYSNIYLFEIDISPLEQQKRNREFEMLVDSCIMNTIRDNLPIEELLRKYIDETQEIEVKKEDIILKDKVKIDVNSNIEEASINKELIMVTPNTDINPNKSLIPIKDEVIPDIVIPSVLKKDSDIHLSWEPTVIDNENKTALMDSVNLNSLDDISLEEGAEIL